jgi:ATP-dependent DNA helicase RecQ
VSAAPARTSASIARVAREALGFDRLRPGQDEAIAPLLDGRDVLAIMPTGYGKSAIYEVAAVIRPGPTVVVSPLIALQRDQARSISQAHAGGVAIENSSIGERDRRRALSDAAGRQLEFLFLAPEQFGNAEVVASLRAARPSLFVVDEAHLVSEWGEDFRPAYQRLGVVADELGRPPVLALTATASPLVRDEIVLLLGLRDPVLVVRGFDRPNIHLAVEWYDDEARKRAALVERVAADGRSGLVYTATRAATESIAVELRAAGVDAAAYHAGLRSAERNGVQSRFTGGDLDVVVATTAFGMGIDRPDVRFVFHHAASASLDEYYQEIGRGGRDGEPASAVLFYLPADLRRRRYQSSGPTVDPATIERTIRTVAADSTRPGGRSIDVRRLAGELGATPRRLERTLFFLERRGAVHLSSGDGAVRVAEPFDGDALVAALSAEATRIARVRSSRVEMMRGYAEGETCRRGMLLSYFGEPFEPPCGACDICDAGVGVDALPAAPGAFHAGDAVRHPEWGDGVVLRVTSDRIVAQFESVGYRTLSRGLVDERGLLRLVG